MAVTCKTVATMRCDGVCPWKVTLPPGLGTHRDRDLVAVQNFLRRFLLSLIFVCAAHRLIRVAVGRRRKTRQRFGESNP